VRVSSHAMGPVLFPIYKRSGLIHSYVDERVYGVE
jgi:hypothetical protein